MPWKGETKGCAEIGHDPRGFKAPDSSRPRFGSVAVSAGRARARRVPQPRMRHAVRIQPEAFAAGRPFAILDPAEPFDRTMGSGTAVPGVRETGGRVCSRFHPVEAGRDPCADLPVHAASPRCRVTRPSIAPRRLLGFRQMRRPRSHAPRPMARDDDFGWVGFKPELHPESGLPEVGRVQCVLDTDGSKSVRCDGAHRRHLNLLFQSDTCNYVRGWARESALFSRNCNVSVCIIMKMYRCLSVL
jgi:hypothetical protein